MTIDLSQAEAHINALTGGNVATAIIDFRAIHDKRRDVPAIPIRGMLSQCVQALDYYQAQGYGIFLVVNETNGNGLENGNITRIRSQFADLDYDDAPTRYGQAMAWDIPPTFAVISSPNRAHIYWVSDDNSDVARYETTQRKLSTMFNGDPKCVDPARVLRLAGSVNLKREQATVATIVAGPGLGKRVAPGTFEWYLAGVAAAGGSAPANALGESEQAPSLDWANYAMSKLDPNDMDRGEWLKTTAAFKASTWSFGADLARLHWDIWCTKYVGNDPGENEKLWSTMHHTKTGWGYLVRSSGIAAELAFANKPIVGTVPDATGLAVPSIAGPGEVLARNVMPIEPVGTATAGDEKFNWLLTPVEQVRYFKGCHFVDKEGLILTPMGRLMTPQKFNGAYGGHEFVISDDGKTSDEPWRAATRGKVFRIGRVDHLRFLPSKEEGVIVSDEFGRKGINTYKPAIVRRVKGDPSPFINHFRRIIPTETDLTILLSYLAHNIQRPGFKVPWAPVIQSTPGAGKGLIKYLMSHALGSVYVFAPNAKELTDGGGKFNAWMRWKLFIICDEIKVDDRRDMLEVLKPMISEERIEIQAKGADQEIEDNTANWTFFTNYKDAIPVDQNERRYSIMYSVMQNAEDLTRAGMDGAYFQHLWEWMKADGAAIVTDYLTNYPIPAEFDPSGTAQRAPETSSRVEAVRNSYGRVEQTIIEAMTANDPGFRSGWISSIMLRFRLKDEGYNAGPQTLKKAYETLGFHCIGRATRGLIQEQGRQPLLYHRDPASLVGRYEIDQGYVVE